MKKIAILTTHRANNFGAVLQAFSLVCACRELGSEAEIFDWRCRHFEWAYHWAWRMYRNPIPALKHLMWFITDERPIRRSFNEFRALMPISKKITSRRELQRAARAYDALIVGSDQVWNPINSAVHPLNFDRSVLLDFVPAGVKKYAYAASMGTRTIAPSSIVPEFVAAWKTFDKITMREHAGAEYVSLQIGRPVETVVDPVLLHDTTFWRKYKKVTGRQSGKFIFVYNVKNSSLLRKVAERRAKELGLELVDVIIPSLVPTKQYEKIGAGPGEFLSYIDEAESVFTNSFHASAFSVIFGKRLFINRAETTVNHNSRFDTLLRFANLDGLRVAKEGNQTVVKVECTKTNSAGLRCERDRSMSVLKEMVI